MDLPITVTMQPALYTDREGQKWAISGQHWVKVPSTMTLDRVSEYMVVEYGIPAATSAEVRSYDVVGSTGNTYTVTEREGIWSCSCPGFGWRRKCKHIEAQKALTTS